MIQTAFTALTLAVCVALLVRLAIGARRRARLDAALRRGWFATRRRAVAAYHWRGHRRHAAKVADEAIRRAREGVERDGNVYKPKSFRKPPRDKMH